MILNSLFISTILLLVSFRVHSITNGFPKGSEMQGSIKIKQSQRLEVFVLWVWNTNSNKKKKKKNYNKIKPTQNLVSLTTAINLMGEIQF